KVVGKPIEQVRIVISGVGAAGVATARIVMAAGARHVIACDRSGAIYAGRSENMNTYKERLAETTNPQRERGSLQTVLRGADVFIGLSGPGVLAQLTSPGWPGMRSCLLWRIRFRRCSRKRSSAWRGAAAPGAATTRTRST